MKTKNLLVLCAALALLIVSCQTENDDEESKPASVHVTKVELNFSSFTAAGGLIFEVGDEVVLSPIFTPANATNKRVSWVSSAPAIAEVDSTGRVKAKSAGIANISVTTEDNNKTAQCFFQVTAPDPEAIAVTGVTLDLHTISLKRNQGKVLNAEITPSDAANQTVYWTSSDKTIAAVNDGVVRGVAAGTAVITVTSVNGQKSDTCNVTVSNETQATITMLSFDDLALRIIMDEDGGDTVDAVLNVSMAAPPGVDPSDKILSWTSSDTTVITIKEKSADTLSATITAHKWGSVTVTATAAGTNAIGGVLKATCTVTVRDDPAIFRWEAENDPGFEDIPINEFRMIGKPGKPQIHMMSMGGTAKATTSVSGKKGYLLNGNGWDRDLETGLYLEGGEEKRSGHGQLVIGTDDFGVYGQLYDELGEPRVDGNGDPVIGYTNRSDADWAPEGELNLFQKFKLIVEFSDMTSGVEGTFFTPGGYGWQIFVLNNSGSQSGSPLGPASRVSSDSPASPPDGRDGVRELSVTGTTLGGANSQLLEKGFISVYSGYGRQLIVRSIVIEPLE